MADSSFASVGSQLINGGFHERFGETEILEREKRLFSSEHRFVNRMRLDALCFQLFLTLGIVAVLAVCLASSIPGDCQQCTEGRGKSGIHNQLPVRTVLYDKDGNELQRLDGSGIRQDYVKLESDSQWRQETPSLPQMIRIIISTMAWISGAFSMRFIRIPLRHSMPAAEGR